MKTLVPYYTLIVLISYSLVSSSWTSSDEDIEFVTEPF